MRVSGISPSIVLFVTVLFVSMLLIGCDSQDIKSSLAEPKPAVPDRYELTATDIFSIPGIHGDQVEVFGVGLGDSQERVLAKLGAPDTRMEFPDIETENFEYAGKLNLTNPGLLLQLKNGVVIRITVKQPFNLYLKGKTIIEHSKYDIYFDLLGIPDSQEDDELLRIFSYEDEGFQIFVKKGIMNGFSMIQPQPVKSPKRKLSPEELAALQPE